MAAITPSSIVRDNAGSNTMLTCTFTTVSDGDTWASGLGKSVISYVAQGSGNPVTQTSAGISAAFSNGTFTFYPSENSLSMILTVFAEI